MLSGVEVGDLTAGQFLEWLNGKRMEDYVRVKVKDVDQE